MKTLSESILSKHSINQKVLTDTILTQKISELGCYNYALGPNALKEMTVTVDDRDSTRIHIKNTDVVSLQFIEYCVGAGIKSMHIDSGRSETHIQSDGINGKVLSGVQLECGVLRTKGSKKITLNNCQILCDKLIATEKAYFVACKITAQEEISIHMHQNTAVPQFKNCDLKTPFIRMRSNDACSFEKRLEDLGLCAKWRSYYKVPKNMNMVPPHNCTLQDVMSPVFQNCKVASHMTILFDWALSSRATNASKKYFLLISTDEKDSKYYSAKCSVYGASHDIVTTLSDGTIVNHVRHVI